MKKVTPRINVRKSNTIIEAIKVALLIIPIVMIYTTFHTILTLFMYSKVFASLSFAKKYNRFPELLASVGPHSSVALSMGVGVGIIFGISASIVATFWQDRLGKPLNWKELIRPLICVFVVIFTICVLSSAVYFLFDIAGIPFTKLKNTHVFYMLWGLGIPLFLYYVYDTRLKRAKRSV